MRRFLLGFLVVLLFPYVVTLAWSGAAGGLAGPDGEKEDRSSELSGRRIFLEQGQKGYVDTEEYLIGAVAGQIPAEYEPEALKAQAILARTYILRQMGDEEEISESLLDPEHTREADLISLWGQEHMAEYYGKIKQAVKETEGMILVWEGQPVEPLFHRVSAGATRNGDSAHPYLQSADSHFDVEAENYLSVTDWEPSDFATRISGIEEGYTVDAATAAESVQMVERDDSGYVEQIQIGSHVYTGEQVRAALELPSPAFTVSSREGKIQTVCRGIGHGLGMSQYGACRMAAEGKTAEEILKHYYKNVEIILPES